MKIGILIKDFENLSNWELRIIDGIFKDNDCELTLLIKDGRIKNESPNSFQKKVKNLMKSGNILGKILFKFQVLIEQKIFKENYTCERDEIINKLKKIECINLNPLRKGVSDIFSDEDSEKVKSYNLDILLRHDFNIIKGKILTSAKYGIWSFHHADNSINRGGPAGLWEIILKEPVVGATLQQLTSELDGGLVIDKGYYNRHWSFFKTNKSVLESSVSILFKNINKLKQNQYNPIKSTVYYNKLYKVPNYKIMLKYNYNFYIKIIEKAFEYIDYKLFGTRYNCWTLFIGKGNFLNATLYKLKPIKLPENEFWADPFIIKYKEENYIFFENYNYKTKKGKISCGKVKGNELIEIKDVLEKNYHLSYPYIFYDNNEIFLIPETSKNKRLEIYRCIEFPNKWELYSTAFDGEMIADTSFYADENGQKWLFLNKQIDINGSMDSELYIYNIDSLKLKKITPHSQNPVIINSKTARNGGSLFKSNNDLFRPSQANINSLYGFALNINKIKTLTINEYLEDTILTIYPNFYDGLISIHHLHQTDDLFVIDAAYKKH